MVIDLKTALATPKLADGAWGTELDVLGCPPGYCREEWNLSHPDLVRQVAAAYVKAGSQIILTNTFSANRFVLERHNLADKVQAFNTAGAQLSKQAADQAWVFASIGPSGRMLIAREVTEDELYKAFFAQAKALAAGGADAIVCESMSELAESLIALRAAKDACGLPVVASMTFDTGSDLRTMMGVTAADGASQLTRAGADAIGCNCGAGIEGCISIAANLRRHTDLPIWAKPNAGLPEIVGDKVVYKETPEAFAARGKELLQAGANIVGGCCGTSPAHIARLSLILKSWQSSS